MNFDISRAQGCCPFCTFLWLQVIKVPQSLPPTHISSPPSLNLCTLLPSSPPPNTIIHTMSTATLPKCWQYRELTLGWLERSLQPSELQPPGPSWFHQAAIGSAPSAQCLRETATGSVKFPTPQPPAGTRTFMQTHEAGCWEGCQEWSVHAGTPLTWGQD